MDEYRRKNPKCEWDGCSDSVHVHHIIPVHVRPDLAAHPDNLITLGASRCHLVIGHAGNWRERYVRNVRELCMQATIERKLQSDEARRYEIRPHVDTTSNAPDNDQSNGRETARKETDR
jgi:hypothetical protein